MDWSATGQDLHTPPPCDGPPAPGRRVRQTVEAYAGTQIHHLLYLPTDWEPGRTYPLIVEYAGNCWRSSPGTVEGSNLGYGLSGGKGCIWLCLPFVDPPNGVNALNWWGDIEATVAYCKTSVEHTCAAYGADPGAVFIAGFSRGSIACNFIGLHDDAIAALWRGFVCHSHYDGVRTWPYPGSDRRAAAARLQRLGHRPQFVSHENDVEETRAYLYKSCPDGRFTFVSLPFADHTDTWVLHDIPPRRQLRRWFTEVSQPDTTP